MKQTVLLASPVYTRQAEGEEKNGVRALRIMKFT